MLKTVFKVPSPPQWADLLQRRPFLFDEACDSIGWLLSNEQIEFIYNGLKQDFCYMPDRPGNDQWGNGVWQERVMSKGLALVGDCDDFAVAVLVSLRDAGAAIKSMHLVICKDPEGRSHMVAALSQVDKTWIFCNQQNRVAEINDPIFKDYFWIQMNRGNDWYVVTQD